MRGNGLGKQKTIWTKSLTFPVEFAFFVTTKLQNLKILSQWAGMWQICYTIVQKQKPAIPALYSRCAPAQIAPQPFGMSRCRALHPERK
ncbi:hypothetical protein KFK14_06490 [Sphingobium phenoxybenzoativorans]|uniref:Uncharacterized protein n=1 Tax=Sphingobium phenoxybenzoativorans TaxID=1592790 RepID=A0A975K9Q1_9SPHN|nr:hypothetical protein [Sphingobium phenoxybenzoativorans]QUT07067.1 hypothetical protein KFK14_06490 [Sphingobium phenoxybenzoativorans]